VKFNTRIYHPNIKTDTGDICTDVLNDNWGPTLNVRYVLNALKQVSSILHSYMTAVCAAAEQQLQLGSGYTF
jgi:ubiquitin-protein ligase